MQMRWRRARWGILALAAVLAACGGEDDADPEAASANNTAPTIAGTPSKTVAAGAVYSFMPTAADNDGDPLIFGIDAKPAWAAFDTKTGQLSGTPAATDAGMYPGIVVWVSDGDAEAALAAFDLTVTAPTAANRPPQIGGTPAASAVAGSGYTFSPVASDPDGNALSFTIRNRPVWASFDAATGRLEGTPLLANVGTFADIGISVTDGQATVALPDFSIVVTAPTTNRAPVISGTPMTSVEAGTAYQFTPTATDPDDNPLTFAIAGQPAWAAFDQQTGRLSGTPPAGTSATFSNIQISVSDGTLSAALTPFSITVTAPTPNRAPVITGTPATTALQGTLYTFDAGATDADGDTLTFDIANRPTWATFNTSTGVLQGTPGAAHIRTYSNIVISVSDGKATAALPPFSIAVASSNTPPLISGTPATSVNAGTQYSFTPTASDANAGTTLTFSIQNRPSWAQFSTSTGRLQGTPTSANAGTFANIVISVSDGQDTTALAPFSIRVNRAPLISGTPSSNATAGSAYSFVPTASDPDGDTVTFSITNKPAWATLNATTGALQGTPGVGNVGTTSGIVITASDGSASTSLAAFSITVNAANAPPVISGTPATSVQAGATYSFTPTATDPNGGTLTFSIQNRPTWATFSTTTGRLQGTPTAANVGTFADIVISVSDGALSAAFTAFSIAVTEPPNRPPVISGTPSTQVMQGSLYSFTPTASDPDTGDTLTFSIANKPGWATFDTSTGALQGTPGAGDVGTTSNVTISVRDQDNASAALTAFSITVQSSATGSALLSWTPPTENTDGSPLTNLNGYKVYWGPSAGSYSNTVTLNNQPGLSSYVVDNLTPGTWFFVVTALSTSGVESQFSNAASKTIP